MAFTHFSDLDLLAFSRELELSFVNFYLGFSSTDSKSRHPHARLIFFFQADGTAFFDDGTSRLILHGGDWVLVPPFVELRHCLNAAAPHLSLHFTLQACGGIDMLAGKKQILFGNDPAMLPEIRREITGNDRVSLMMFFREICWKYLRKVRHEFPVFQHLPELWTNPETVRLFRLLTENASPKLTMRKFARIAGIPKDSLIKKLTASIGIPPGQVVDRILVMRAIRLLVDEKRSVKETAYALAFRDPYGFSRFFRRMTGAPPGQFSRRFRKAPSDTTHLISIGGPESRQLASQFGHTPATP